MENKLEQLLNSLIEKGWKPSGKECSHFILQYNADVLDWKVIYTAIRKDEGVYNIHYTLRELVSKESGLWQFVCENGMVEKGGLFWELGYSSGEIDLESRRRRQDYEYRLIRSALIAESELEDFLLSNIKVDVESK